MSTKRAPSSAVAGLSPTPLHGERDASAVALPDFSESPAFGSGTPVVDEEIDPLEVILMQQEMIDHMCKEVAEAGRQCKRAREIYGQTTTARRLANQRRCTPRAIQ